MRVLTEPSEDVVGANVSNDGRRAVFQRADHASPFRLIALAPGVAADEVAAKTTANSSSFSRITASLSRFIRRSSNTD